MNDADESVLLIDDFEDDEAQLDCLSRNGCYLAKRNKQSKVFEIMIVQEDHVRITQFPKIVVGYKVRNINNNSISRWSEKQLAQYLANNDIVSIESCPIDEVNHIYNARKRQKYANRNESTVAKTRESRISRINLNIEQHRSNERLRSAARRASTNSNPMKRITLRWDKQCPICKYVHLNTANRGDMLRCCQGGTLRNAHFSPLYPLNDDLKELFAANTAHISRSSSTYNNLFAMCATKVVNDHGGGFEHDMVGNHCVKMNGRIYKWFPHASNSTEPSGGLSYFMFDSQAAMSNHQDELNLQPGAIYDIIRSDIRRELKLYLDNNNRYAQSLALYGINESLTQDSLTHASANIRGQIDFFEVGFASSDRANGYRELEILGSNGRRNLCMSCKEVEPISYPLIFLNGEDGYSLQTPQNVSYNSYVVSRILMPEMDNDESVWYMMSADGRTELPCNRFQVMSRLTQVYVVDMVARAIDHKLDWLEKNQNIIRNGETWNRSSRRTPLRHPDYSDNENDSNEEDELDHQRPENNDFLPSSVFGSRRYLRGRALNALKIVADHGKATGFLTLTTNVKWPEITERLLEGQDAYDRPDITVQVFHARLEAFLNLLRKGKFFDSNFKKLNYLMYVIEYQHRGLPHGHIVYQLDGAPDENSGHLIDFINGSFCAELPQAVVANDPQNEDSVVLNLVKKHMIHSCSTASNGCLKQVGGQCRRGYSDLSDLIEQSYLNERGFPIYRRRTVHDRRIVPYNRKMLIAWDGHCNHEYAGNTKSVLYLYKYLFKGPKKVAVDITTASNNNCAEEKIEHNIANQNEITQFVRTRFLSSMDATWRIFGYKTYPAPSPKVIVVKVKSEEAVRYDNSVRKISSMAIYLARPNIFLNMTMCQFYEAMVVYFNALPVRCRNDRSSSYYKIIPFGYSGNTEVFVCHRERKALCRIEMLYITAGEKWYLRLIMLNKCPRSFLEARSYDGQCFRTYQEAALVQGLVTEHRQAIQCFQELMTISLPFELRGFFCTLMIQGFPMKPVYEEELIQERLIEDFLVSTGGNRNQSLRLFWLDVVKRLENASADRLEAYGFETPSVIQSELDRQLHAYDVEVESNKLQQMLQMSPNNEQQHEFFQRIMFLARSTAPDLDLFQSTFHFLAGVGGAGKTDICKKLIAGIRSLGHIVLVCASTSLAASNYEDSFTAHSLFKYPVDEDEENLDPSETIDCKLDKTQRCTLLKRTKFIIWDEFVNNDRRLFEAVMTFYKRNNIYCNFICVGDFRQIPPVVKHGTDEETQNALISSSTYWQNFSRTHLDQNMRLTALRSTITEDSSEEDVNNIRRQQAFAHNIVALAEGRETEDFFKCPDICELTLHKSVIVLKNIKHFIQSSIDEALLWLYDNQIFDPYSAISNCILAATNESGDFWNKRIQNLNTGASRIYDSFDKLCEIDDTNGILQKIISSTRLYEATSSGVPAHFLELKVYDICIMLRALPAQGLATNQRVRILTLRNNSIEVQTLDREGKRVFVPRIHFKFGISFGPSYKMMRTQFPLRPAYCMTYNKSQGQTFRKVLLDITHEPFAHGHCYVAMSRVQNCDDIAIYCSNDQIYQDTNGNEYPKICNIVYKNVLANNYNLPVGITRQSTMT